MNESTKTELTRATANHLKTAAEADDEGGEWTQRSLLLQLPKIMKVYQLLLNAKDFLSLKVAIISSSGQEHPTLTRSPEN